MGIGVDLPSQSTVFDQAISNYKEKIGDPAVRFSNLRFEKNVPLDVQGHVLVL